VTPGPDDATTGDGEAPRPLRTEPRPLLVHFLVITAVAFLATIIVGLFLGAPWWAVLLVAAVIGAAVAPMSRRSDERAMAARRAG
jgi:hypothetical protein